MEDKLIYCNLVTCNKTDCIYHYRYAPWGEIFKVKKYKTTDKECTQYKKNGQP